MLIEACAAEYDCRLWIELWSRALRDRARPLRASGSTTAGATEIAEVVRAGQDLGEFAGDDGDDVAAIIASLMDGLAVQVTLGDPAIAPDRMRDLAVASRSGCSAASCRQWIATSWRSRGERAPGNRPPPGRPRTPETWTMRRRELLQAGAGLALGVALAGCGIGSRHPGGRQPE